MPRFLSVAPNSDAWLKSRIGKITASRLVDVTSKLAKKSKNGEAGDPSAKALGYKMELVSERLTNVASKHHVTEAMEHGTEYEPMARAVYEMSFDLMVDRIGFALHPTLDYSGASPDALVGKDGLLEIKCPETDTHLEWMMAGDVPEKHKPQMLWNMVCCERNWCDFMSFDPRIEDPELQSFCVRLDFDQALADKYTAEVVKFNSEIEELIAKLKKGKD